MTADNQYFYVLPGDVADDESTLILREDEAHHCLRVLRKKPGDEFYAVNGCGREYLVQLVENHYPTALCKILHAATPPRELPWQITLGMALIKNDRFEWMLEKAVELGVFRIVPIQTARSVPESGSGKQSRWQKIVLAAMKQCRRAVLTAMDPPQPFASFIQQSFTHRLLFHESAESPLSRHLSASRLSGGETIALLIGPEGGFTDQEIDIAHKHLWNVLSLGPRRLRSETAALSACAFFSLYASRT